MDVTIEFRCLFRCTPLGKSAVTKMFTQVRRTFNITVRDVPEERWSQKHRDSDVLWQAEQGLLAKINAEHPADDLLGWDAYGPDQKLLSSFIVTLSNDSP